MASATDFLVFKGAEIFRLHKGISPDEVRNLLGNDYAFESCLDDKDQKWVYDFPGTKGSYKMFFRQDKLEWAMNGTFLKKVKPIKLEIVLHKNKRKNKL